MVRNSGFFLTVRNLETDPDTEVWGYLLRPLRLSGREKKRKSWREAIVRWREVEGKGEQREKEGERELLKVKPREGKRHKGICRSRS